jgi:quercetin dioxygenase-like cupin family protein
MPARGKTERSEEDRVTYPDGDPRARMAPTPATGGWAAATRPPVAFALAGEEPDQTHPGGSRSWVVRGQNFWVSLTDLVVGERLGPIEHPDEHIIVVSQGSVRVTAGDGTTTRAAASSVVIVPAGACSVIAESAGRIVRVFPTSDHHGLARARNAEAYRTPDPSVAEPSNPDRARTSGLVVHRMDDVETDPRRLGRILRSSSLMINWFPDETVPRDPERLSPHSHDDFEQCTITLAGEYMHHLRTTWTPQMSAWRDDLHVRVDSPSVTIIPPQIIHTTRAVAGAFFQLLDVFAPPRRDFLAQGWVLNAEDYAGTP